MPKVETRKARTDIYERGIRVPANTKSGYRKDKSQPHPDGDRVVVTKGTTYYAWSFNFGPSFISLTKPRRSQLTQSEFLGTIYDIEDRIAELSCSNESELQSERDEIVSELESLRDETQEKFDNMPDGLQQGDTGQLLEERVQQVEDAIDEFENLDLDYSEPTDEELEDDVDPDSEDKAAELDRLREEKLEEWVSEKLQEMQEISIQG